jgi:hypothetical protein
MKQIIGTVLLIAAIALIALPATSAAQAGVTTTQEFISLEGIPVGTPEGCEDLVHVAGTLHAVYHLTALDDGGYLLVLHTNPQGAVTQGVDTGTLYRGTGVGQSVARTLGPGESSTTVDVFYQVPLAGIQLVVHVTLNANGELTSYVEHAIAPGFSCTS